MFGARELGHSLQEIYNALHPDGYRAGDPLPLFANSLGQIYSEKPFSALLIKIYHVVMRFFFGGPQQPSNEDALRFVLNTLFNHVAHVAFQGRQKRIAHYVRSLSNPTQEQEQRYANFLSEELQGSVREGYTPLFLQSFNHRIAPLNEVELINLTRISANFEQYIAPFWKICLRDNEPSLQLIERLNPYLDDAQNLVLRDRVLYNAIAKENTWGQLEGSMNRRIPVSLLAKLHDPTTLTVNEREELESWVGKLNECRTEISPEMLSTVLNETARIISIAGDNPTTFQDIIFWLHQNGCQVANLNEHDRSYLALTAPLLRPGQTLSCQGQEYTLGRRIESQENNTFAIFEIGENVNLEMRIPINRFVHPILLRSRLPEDRQILFPLPRVIASDPETGFLVQERLNSSFSDHQWTSQSDELNVQDHRFAFGFAFVLCCLKEWRETFENFSLSDIKLLANGEWRASKQWERAPYNYQRLEEYCMAAAAGNPHVLRYLMQVSKLHEDPSAVYYREVVSGVFEGTLSSERPPLPPAGVDAIYGQELMRRAEGMKRLAVNQTSIALLDSTFYQDNSLIDIPQMVSQQLLELYLASPMPGRLEDHLVQRVVASCSSRSVSQSRASSSSEVSNLQHYYEADYQAVLEYARLQIIPHA